MIMALMSMIPAWLIFFIPNIGEIRIDTSIFNSHLFKEVLNTNK